MKSNICLKVRIRFSYANKNEQSLKIKSEKIKIKCKQEERKSQIKAFDKQNICICCLDFPWDDVCINS